MKTFTAMTPAEREENRKRLNAGWPADYEADRHGQTAESKARDAARRKAADARTIAELSKIYGKSK